MLIQAGIGGLAVIVAGSVVLLVAHAWRPAAIGTAVGIVLLMTIQWKLAASGALSRWDQVPPPFVVVLAVSFALTLGLALSPIGAHVAGATSIGTLIAFQTFRIPLELVMHQAAERGIMPAQMTYTGWNFDIVTGVTAFLLTSARYGPWSRRVSVVDDSGADVGGIFGARETRAPRWVLVGWNLMGSILLFNVVAVAVASTPPIAAFGSSPDRLNTWVAEAPYIWLPGVLVQAALFGHIVLWRKLVR